MDFLETLVRYETDLWNRVQHELARRGLEGLGTLMALRVISKHEGRARVQELSRDLGITIGAASKLADRLERDGLAVRHPNPEDRRSSLIALTPIGEGAKVSGETAAEAALARLVGSSDDVVRITRTLARLQSRLTDTRTEALA